MTQQRSFKTIGAVFTTRRLFTLAMIRSGRGAARAEWQRRSSQFLSYRYFNGSAATANVRSASSWGVSQGGHLGSIEQAIGDASAKTPGIIWAVFVPSTSIGGMSVDRITIQSEAHSSKMCVSAGFTFERLGALVAAFWLNLYKWRLHRRN